ncbi:DUF5994 family protein [Streptomyces sp. Je 1-369]|uniref:DUF5994 family protein n=1 Tax=Streptomyces sp. Je 1-369 TaxID=2966192 RepID=UPI002285C8C4|nr:DUF5994 family protein [Streptomyces sp. Je 1-369]WAL98388.1 DUF5994 family protein [Streptomyces sp. Je 1-369]
MTLTPRPPLFSPPAVRLRLAPESAQGGALRRINGVWWPHSPDLVSELPGLFAELPSAWGQITSVLVDETVWSPFPGRVRVADQVVRLRRTTAQRAPSTVCLLAPGRGRWDLLVVPPAAADAEVGRLMESMACPLEDRSEGR